MALDLQDGSALQLQDGTDLELQAGGAAGPVITLQPQDASVLERLNATFTGDATGTGVVNFQWYEVGVGILPGEIGKVLTIFQVSFLSDDQREFYFTATDDVGSEDSATATLTVNRNSSVIHQGDLGQAGYPSFFPCPTWEYSQAVTGHLGRTPFDSGWTRQRKSWREQNSAVNLSFQMPTLMFEKWSRWMVNNGYEWFTMFLDTLNGEKALNEVRLVGPFDYSYRSWDTVEVTAPGELGGPLYGPEDGPLTGDPSPSTCVPAYVTNTLPDYDDAAPGEVIVLTVEVNPEATNVEFQWYQDGVLMPGETSDTLNYEVPGIAGLGADFKTRFAASVENDCSGTFSNTATVTVPAAQECEPYSCSALDEQMGEEFSNILGAGAWDLLDPNTSNIVPATFQETAAYGNGAGLFCSNVGNPYGNGGLMDKAMLTTEDLDLCEGPWGLMNSGVGGDSLRLTPQQIWGTSLPNASIAIVINGIEAFSLDSNNRLFTGSCLIGTYGQLGGTDISGFDARIGCARNSGGTQDTLQFNRGKPEFDAYMDLPLGFWNSGTPKLVEAELYVSQIDYLPNADQSPVFARYDVFITFQCVARVTDGGTKIQYNFAQAVTGFFGFSYDPTKGDANSGPIDPAYRVFNPGGVDTCRYMTGNIDLMYNLSVSHNHGGQAGGQGTKFVPAIPPGIGKDLSIAFLRNFDDYEVPEYCNTEAFRNRGRDRT